MNKPNAFSYANRPPEDPIDKLLDALSEMGWTQQKFAQVTGRPPQMISAIVNGKKEITRETALQFEAVLGIPAEVWLAMQNDYQLWEMRRNDSLQVQLAMVRDRAKRASS